MAFGSWRIASGAALAVAFGVGSLSFVPLPAAAAPWLLDLVEGQGAEALRSVGLEPCSSAPLPGRSDLWSAEPAPGSEGAGYDALVAGLGARLEALEPALPVSTVAEVPAAAPAPPSPSLPRAFGGPVAVVAVVGWSPPDPRSARLVAEAQAAVAPFRLRVLPVPVPGPPGLPAAPGELPAALRRALLAGASVVVTPFDLRGAGSCTSLELARLWARGVLVVQPDAEGDGGAALVYEGPRRGSAGGFKRVLAGASGSRDRSAGRVAGACAVLLGTGLLAGREPAEAAEAFLLRAPVAGGLAARLLSHESLVAAARRLLVALATLCLCLAVVPGRVSHHLSAGLVVGVVLGAAGLPFLALWPGAGGAAVTFSRPAPEWGDALLGATHPVARFVGSAYAPATALVVGPVGACGFMAGVAAGEAGYFLERAMVRPRPSPAQPQAFGRLGCAAGALLAMVVAVSFLGVQHARRPRES